MKENDFKLTRKEQKIPRTIFTDADSDNYIALLANTPTQAESQLHSLERVAAGIGHHFNADKTVYMCFNQRVGLWNSRTGSPTLEVVFHQRLQPMNSKSMDSYRWTIGQMEVKLDR